MSIIIPPPYPHIFCGMYSHSDGVIKTKIKVATHKIINVGSYHHQAMHTGAKLISKRAFALSFMITFHTLWTIN